ncbi:DNA polymerase epsilon subunit B-like [Camellia sinensis]|uniref:DNA polymerase epsilon subunit B-like n=1 Tax=Camellia sinensis TaxID=4442 RepID=UPI001035926B|nr:DNA polymerase epsilon subunit B-like [Camellia sinensis]
MVMLLPKPLYIGIDFSCCSRGFLVISISKPAFDTERSQFGSCEISPIQSLIGLTGRRWVMGVICQSEDGHFYLEDLTRAVEINLSNVIFSSRLYFSLSRDLLSILNAWIWAAL